MKGGGKKDFVAVSTLVADRNRWKERAEKAEKECAEWKDKATRHPLRLGMLCGWCGEKVPLPEGTLPGAAVTRELWCEAFRGHLAVCQRHPIRELEARLKQAEANVTGLLEVMQQAGIEIK